MGAKFVTILLLVARVAKTGSQNTGKKTEEKKVIFRVLLGGWGGSDQLQGEWCHPPVFINIWPQNGGFASEGCIFRISGIPAPLKELT